jgi:hypothetical protein
MFALDVWAAPMDGDRKPFPIVQTEFEERDGQFSPDGKWIAYQYIALDGRLMAVPVKLASNAQPVEVSAPVALCHRRWRSRAGE